MHRTTPKELTFTPEDLFLFGMNDLAYVKPVLVSGHSCYGVFAADGTPLLVTKERDVAFAAIRENDMQPASVH